MHVVMAPRAEPDDAARGTQESRGRWQSCGRVHGAWDRIGRTPVNDGKEAKTMIHILTSMAVIFLLLWLVGFALHLTLSGFIHVLLLLAVASTAARLVMGRRRVA